MERYELKRLSMDALRKVYKEDLTLDFPVAERKPLAAMEKLYIDGRYDLWGLYQGEHMAAYALLWADPDGGFVLLDYLGICHDHPKGDGAGTAMVRALMERYTQAAGVLVEAEAVEEGLSPEENEIRTRRLHFYHKLGFQDLSYTAKIFGVRYAMLLTGGRAEEEAMEAHMRLYHYEFSPWLYDRFICIPESD